jgi:hypothetical protein
VKVLKCFRAFGETLSPVSLRNPLAGQCSSLITHQTRQYLVLGCVRRIVPKVADRDAQLLSFFTQHTSPRFVFDLILYSQHTPKNMGSSPSRFLEDVGTPEQRVSVMPRSP